MDTKTARFINDGECGHCDGEGFVVIGSGEHQESTCAICGGWGVLNPRYETTEETDPNKVVSNGGLSGEHDTQLVLKDWLTHDDRIRWPEDSRSMTSQNNAQYLWS